MRPKLLLWRLVPEAPSGQLVGHRQISRPQKLSATFWFQRLPTLAPRPNLKEEIQQLSLLSAYLPLIEALLFALGSWLSFFWFATSFGCFRGVAVLPGWPGALCGLQGRRRQGSLPARGPASGGLGLGSRAGERRGGRRQLVQRGWDVRIG